MAVQTAPVWWVNATLEAERTEYEARKDADEAEARRKRQMGLT
jgi:hypothetical protein